MKISNRNINLIISIVLLFLTAYFAYLLFQVRPQSDDWGFVNYVKHYNGVYKFYLVERQTMDVSLSYLLFIFPIVVLSDWIGGPIVMLTVYLVLIHSFYHLFNTLNLKYNLTFNRTSLAQTSIILVLLIVFSSWNRNSYQNATFWITGVGCYIVPLILFLYSALSLIKGKGVASFILFLLLANTRINFTLITGIIITSIFYLNWNQIKKNWQFWIFPSSGFIVGSIYYILAPGNLVRFKGSSSLGEINKLELDFYPNINKILSTFKFLFTEPVYLTTFFLILLLIALNNIESIKKINLNSKIHALLYSVGLFITIYILHSYFIQIILKGNLGYGRIFIFTHFLFVILCSTLIILFVHWINEKYQRYVYGIVILLLTFSLWPLFQQIRLDLYKASRFAAQYDYRLELMHVLANKEEPISCVVLNRFNDSGILGHLDFPETNDCFSERNDTWVYTSTPSYDNWAYEKYYDLPFKVSINVNNDSLDSTYHGQRYKTYLYE